MVAALLLLCSCGSNENKKLTAKDLEGTWTVSESSSFPDGELTALAGFLVSARSNTNAVVIFKDGKITTEWEAEDRKKTSELGSYKVSDGTLFINGFQPEVKLEGKTPTLFEMGPATKEEESKKNDNEAALIEMVPKTVMILEKK